MLEQILPPEVIAGAWNACQEHNARWATAGLPPKTRRRRRKTLARPPPLYNGKQDSALRPLAASCLFISLGPTAPRTRTARHDQPPAQQTGHTKDHPRPGSCVPDSPSQNVRANVNMDLGEM
jgi:hypothetical protein